ncbi:unnamed protein product [Prorocentrum cordatum]|uniref:Pentatricopeptide repeat-containing protein n=1 Tax=Prorocentrum cordatum TaxID=2364126 RepID=A0ABN9X173_9DINO|nr:unnamed protein product [Polarella glacialis]
MYCRLNFNRDVNECGKGSSPQHALGEWAKSKMEPQVINDNAGTSTSESGRNWQRALLLLSEGGMRGWSRHHRCNARISACEKGQVVAAGAGAAAQDVGGEVGAQRLSHNVGITACEKGEQWQRALALLSEMWEAKLEPNADSYSPATVALLRRDDATGASVATFWNSA